MENRSLHSFKEYTSGVDWSELGRGCGVEGYRGTLCHKFCPQVDRQPMVQTLWNEPLLAYCALP